MYIVGLAFIFMVPLASVVEEVPQSVHVDAAASYPCALLFGLTLIVSQNIAGSVSSQAGGSDYLPLILSRPISRSSYVLSKLLALVTLILVVSILQFCVLNFLYLCLVSHGNHIDPTITVCALGERILDAFSVSIALVMVSLLPTRQMFGFGVIALELIALNRLFFDFDFYSPATSDLFTDSLIRSGLFNWLHAQIFWILPWRDLIYPFQFAFTFIGGVFDIIGPRFFVYDFFTNAAFDWLPLFNYLFNISAGLMVCLIMINSRDFNYAAE